MSLTEIVLCGRFFDLNKSKTKYLLVGWNPLKNFTPVVKVCSSRTNHGVSFSVNEWNSFCSQEKFFTDVLATESSFGNTIHDSTKNYCFENINGTLVLKISDNNGFVFIGKETLSTILDVKALVNLYLKQLVESDITYVYKAFLSFAVKDMKNVAPESLKAVLEKKKMDYPTLVYSGILEYLVFYPRQVIEDIGKFKGSC